ncbi:hypothetical protein [Sharpea azabuensis]|uniref:hypothetical protein n=1 Tax=Sharpea azabuensis TaxID=322505 RepID=UPI001569C420|nr:hypothetical protein [Sharpea azabuensis]
MFTVKFDDGSISHLNANVTLAQVNVSHQKSLYNISPLQAPTSVQSLEDEVPVATYILSLVVSMYCCHTYVGVVEGAVLPEVALSCFQLKSVCVATTVVSTDSAPFERLSQVQTESIIHHTDFQVELLVS